MSQVGDYTLGKVIGMGASSKVRLALHVSSLEKVAVKSIEKRKLTEDLQTQADIKLKIRETMTSPQKQAVIREMGGLPEDKSDFDECEIESIESSSRAVGTLAEEVRLLMRLNHPNIIKIYEAIETSSELHLILEYAPNGSFHEFFKREGGRLDEPAARVFFRQMVSAVDHCHAAGVAHRDLKMENMLLNAQNQILLTDFGLGRSLLSTNTFCGTPSHVAIEVIHGIPYNAKSADAWSLGIILFMMVAGKNPFEATTIQLLYKRVKALDYSFPEIFSMDLRDLITLILVKNPSERLTAVEIATHFWVTQGDGDWNMLKMGQSKTRASSIVSISSDSSSVIYKFRSQEISKNKEATKIFGSMRTASNAHIRRRASSEVKASFAKADSVDGVFKTARVKSPVKSKGAEIAGDQKTLEKEKSGNDEKSTSSAFTRLFTRSDSVKYKAHRSPASPLNQSIPENAEERQ